MICTCIYIFFFQNFQGQSNLLFKILSSVRSHNASPHLAQLLLRLDFNRYFSIAGGQLGRYFKQLFEIYNIHVTHYNRWWYLNQYNERNSLKSCLSTCIFSWTGILLSCEYLLLVSVFFILLVALHDLKSFFN